jgi:chromosome segregation ATPase
LGITDLVGELNIIKNQNKIALKKMNKLNSMNKKLNDDYKILEENFRITLSKINEKNSNLYIKEEIYKANDRSEKNNSIIKQNRASIIRINELKKDYEELNIEYKELLSKQQEFDFDKNILLNKENQSQTQLLTTENNLKTLKEKNNSLKNDKNISTEKLSKAKEEYNNIKSKCDANKTKLNKLNQENENFLMKSAEFIKINKNKNEILKMKENNEILVKENKNLLKERDVLNQEKNQLSSELEKLKQEINELNQINSSNILSTENNDIINELRAINENRKNELKKLKEEYESLVNEQKILQENYEKLTSKNNVLNASMVSMSVVSVNGYQLSPDEYEEYDLLRKNKDENEALILQLKSNNQAKEVEKQELKEMLKNLTGKK